MNEQNSKERVLYKELCAKLDSNLTPPTESDLKDYRDRIQSINKDFGKVAEGIYRVKSPWHAAIFCIDLMACE